MNDIDHQILLVGLPNTGKTSFLAAFYHNVVSELPDKIWHEYRLSPDSEYINTIHNEWLQCKTLQRTAFSHLNAHNVLIYLQNKESGDKVTIQIPDLAGEMFQSQWSNRYWQKEYKQAVELSTGLLFFINADNIKSPISFNDVIHDLGDFIEQKNAENDHEENSASISVDFSEDNDIYKIWEPHDAPTQVVAVDLIQFHTLCLNNGFKLPIAVIVSAWDTVHNINEAMSPNEWLEESMPLLWQFLKSNSETVDFKVYGVSAQGGDITNNDIYAQLCDYNEPADRVLVKEDNVVYKDIGAPIQWLIDSWKIQLQ